MFNQLFEKTVELTKANISTFFKTYSFASLTVFTGGIFLFGLTSLMNIPFFKAIFLFLFALTGMYFWAFLRVFLLHSASSTRPLSFKDSWYSYDFHALSMRQFFAVFVGPHALFRVLTILIPDQFILALVISTIAYVYLLYYINMLTLS